MKNSQTRAAVIWFSLSITGILSAALSGKYISSFDLRGAVTLLGIFLALSGLIVGLMFTRRSCILHGMFNGKDVIVSFSYPEHEMLKLADQVEEERLEINSIRFAFITVIVIIVAVIVIAMMIADESYGAIGPLLLVFLLLEASMYAASKLSPAAARRRLMKSGGEVIISPEGMLFCGELHIWKALGSKLERVYPDKKEGKHLLCFSYSYHVSFIPPIKNTFEVRIPLVGAESDEVPGKVFEYFKI